MTGPPVSAARCARRHRLVPRSWLLLVLCVPVIAFSAGRSWGEPLFTAAFLPFDTGVDPVSVAIGDLNGDGKPDLVTADRSSDVVSVVLGNGDGTFGAKVDDGTGSNPFSVAMGDVSGDGKPDLVTANVYSSTVSVLLGNGDGTFGAKGDYETGTRPVSVAMGDVSGDGKPDLAVANLGLFSPYGSASVLLGNGDGSFGAKVGDGTGSKSQSVAIAEVSGGGKPDTGLASQSDPLHLTGRRVRLLAPELGARKLTGTVAEVRGDTLLFTADNQSTRTLVRTESLTGLEVYQGASTHVLAGAGLGLLAGAIVGGVIVGSGDTVDDETRGVAFAFGALVGGGVGLLIGAFIGSWHTERWESLQLPISIGFLPRTDAIGLSVGFTN